MNYETNIAFQNYIKCIGDQEFGNDENGYYCRTTSSGTKLMETNYVNGKINGHTTLYYRSNGKKYIDCNLIDGIMDYDDDNYEYKSGKFDGEYLEYYNNGQILIHCFYTNGLKNGKYKSYFKNGNVQKECEYINDKIHGLCTTYYENNTEVMKCYYDNGIIKSILK